MRRPDVTVLRYRDLADPAAVAPDLDAIFFEASATRSFPDEAARRAFRERWLGRYLAFFPSEAFLASAADSRVVGYIVGCLEDPLAHPLFQDIAYFELFREPVRRYPAHLHINLAPDYRGMGIGRRLIETFAAHAAAAGVSGMHAVTGDGSRNNTFYQRCGFERLSEVASGGGRLAFFARTTAPFTG